MNQNSKTIKVFISPRPSADSRNVYITKLAESLSQQMTVLNSAHKKTTRSKDLIEHAFKADLFILNWSEDTVALRHGLIQAFIFNIGVLVARLRGAKILWVCHNRKTHHAKNQRFNKLNRLFFKKVAHKILVHSGDAKQHLESVAAKLIHIPHPRYDQADSQDSNMPALPVRPQVLIWGSISPYKGLETFIEQYKQHKQNFETLIIGKAKPAYHQHLQALAAGTNISIVNEFIDDEALNALFAQTKIVLLPYLNTDTFSSGALIHSLNSGKVVIGPEVGNFIDLKAEDACLTYKGYPMLFETVNNLLQNEAHYQETLSRMRQGIDNYYFENSWEDFAGKLQTALGMDSPVPGVQKSVTLVTSGSAAPKRQTTLP